MNFICREDHWGCSNCHTGFEILQRLVDGFQLGGYQRERVTDGTESNERQLLRGDILSQTSFDNYFAVNSEL